MIIFCSCNININKKLQLYLDIKKINPNKTVFN